MKRDGQSKNRKIHVRTSHLGQFCNPAVNINKAKLIVLLALIFNSVLAYAIRKFQGHENGRSSEWFDLTFILTILTRRGIL